VEFHVRSARLTDVDPAIRIILRDQTADTGERRADADRLRSLLFLPAATVVVAEAERAVVGVGVLSIRPAVRSGPFVGTIDELGLSLVRSRTRSAAAVADAAVRERIGSSIVEHLIASARNKGCARVDVTDPLATAESALLKSAGFARRGTLLSRATG
jgi:hypothetical protein